MRRVRRAQASRGSPQIRCYHCQGIFTSAIGSLHTNHVRCPYCQTINGVPPQGGARTSLAAALNAERGGMPPLAQAHQEQLLRRLQQREITPLELLILREFVEHLHLNRPGASSREIDAATAEWVVDDVSKLPEELRTCCVCLEEVCREQRVRTLPCLHTFHADCAEEWLQKKKVCPLCQFPIDSTGEAPAGEADVEADAVAPIEADASADADAEQPRSADAAADSTAEASASGSTAASAAAASGLNAAGPSAG